MSPGNMGKEDPDTHTMQWPVRGAWCVHRTARGHRGWLGRGREEERAGAEVRGPQEASS